MHALNRSRGPHHGAVPRRRPPVIAHRAAIPARSRNRRCPARGTSRSQRRTCSKRAIPSTPPPSTLGPRVDHGLSRWQPHRANAGEQPIGGVHRGTFALEAFRLDRYRQVAVFPAGHGNRIRRSDCNFGPTVLHTRLATRITMPASWVLHALGAPPVDTVLVRGTGGAHGGTGARGSASCRTADQGRRVGFEGTCRAGCGRCACAEVAVSPWSIRHGSDVTTALGDDRSYQPRSPRGAWIDDTPAARSTRSAFPRPMAWSIGA